MLDVTKTNRAGLLVALRSRGKQYLGYAQCTNKVRLEHLAEGLACRWASQGYDTCIVDQNIKPSPILVLTLRSGIHGLIIGYIELHAGDGALDSSFEL